jgi:Bacterial PH domain
VAEDLVDDTRDKQIDKKNKVRGVDFEHGESVVLMARPSIAAVWPRYLITLGLYGLWRRQNLTVLTNRRVLVGKGIISRKEQTLPLARINDAVYVRKGLYAYSEIASTLRGRSHVQRVGPLAPRLARRFTQEITART